MTRLELLQQCEAFIRGFEGDEMQYDAPVESMLEGLRAEIKVERDREELIPSIAKCLRDGLRQGITLPFSQRHPCPTRPSAKPRSRISHPRARRETYDETPPPLETLLARRSVTDAVFLEKAYDGAQSRIEILEERVRELHLLVAVAANGEYGPDWISTALEVLASIPADPTLTETRNA